MGLLILDHETIRRLLPMSECIEVLRAALIALARGRVHQPLRTVVRPPGAAGLMALMPSYLDDDDDRAFGFKAVCVFHDNPERGKDAHQGVVVLVDPDTGEPLSVLDASAITAVRTAAASAVATDVLARADAHDLAIVGAGVQARSHLSALACVRSLKRVRVVSRRPRHARAFAAEAAEQFEFPVIACDSVAEAVRDADLVVTATTSAEPVIEHAWLQPGVHLNAVGSSIPTARELDSATMAAARIYTDRRESLLNESGDYLFPMREGVVGPENVRGEIGEVLIGQAPGRTSAQQLTVFKSLGLSLEDIAAARYVYAKATQSGAGASVRF